MLWRAWCFLCGLPLGALAAWTWLDSRTPASVPALGALVGGIALLAAASWIARPQAARPAHGVQLAVAACVSLAAWPALAAVWLALPPGPGTLALALCAAQAFALVRSVRAEAAPRGGASLPRAIVVSLAAGSAAMLAVSALVARAAGSGATQAPGRAHAIYDIDAGVATRPLPVCGSEPAQLEVVHARGAHPQLTPDGEHLWFDARDDTGARQIQRLRLSDAEVRCWTCGEPGDNRRPRPGASGLVFETDRHADWRAPSNTEIHWIDARGDAPRQPSRRLTHSAGPDSHPIFAPGGPRVVWSRRKAGYEIVSAPLQRAHGGVSLGEASVLARGGAAWLVPADWSADARALALLRGNPFAPLTATALDLATGAALELGAQATDSGVAFAGDGTFALVVETRRAHIAGLLPAALGAPFAPVAARHAALHRDTLLRAGERSTPGQALAVPELERWGEPTGATLAPDGRSAFVGQRRDDGAERLVRVQLGCS